MKLGVRFTSSFGLGRMHGLFAELLGAKSANRVFVEQALPLGLIEAKNLWVPQRDILGLHERAAQIAGDPLFGVRLGQRRHPEEFGWFARYAVQAPSLSNMFDRFQRTLRYHQNGAVLHFGHHRDFVRWSYRLIEPWEIGRRHHANHAIMPMIEAVRRFLGDSWRPHWVELETEGGPWARGIEDLFQAPVYFGCRANALIIDSAALSCRNRKKASIETQLTIADVRRMMTSKPPEIFVDQVRAIVDLRLMDRETDIDAAAEKLQVSVRTLQRNLATDGWSYRAVVDAVRHRRSIELLAEGTHSVVDIAAALGYSDDAHFIRAFRRWEDRTPMAAMPKERPRI